MHDEASGEGLSASALGALVHLGEDMKDERFRTLEVEATLEAVVAALGSERARR